MVHPQFWPERLVIKGRRFVVIGSGATAVTLVPALVARGAAHVTMLQRSPTYIVARPSRDAKAERLRRRLPSRLAEAAIRWKNIAYGIFVFNLARRKPEVVKRKIADAQRSMLGPNFDIAKHLTPRYAPWDQRLCLVPDADLFKALRAGQASIVTDTIDRITPAGMKLASGQVLDAQVIVTATGLKVQVMGGATISVDGEHIDPGKRLLYKGAMLDGVPNFAFAVGYTNASWTLKCDLTSQLISRVLNHMKRRGYSSVRPVARPGVGGDEPLLDLKSGYVERAASLLPRQGKKAPWKTHQNYVRDLLAFRSGRLEDGVLRFERQAKSDRAA